MKVFLFGISILCLTSIRAQIVLDSEDVAPQINEVFTVGVSEDSIYEGLSGYNRVWDLSQMNIEELRTISYETTSGDYPESNILENILGPGMNRNRFIHLSNTGQILIASGNAGGTSTVQGDTNVLIFYPLTFNASDSCTYGHSISFPGFPGGTVRVKKWMDVDGYGQLITPISIYEDVLRVKTRIIDSLFMLGDTSVTEIINFSWYKKNYHYPLAQTQTSKRLSSVSPLNFYSEYLFDTLANVVESFETVKLFPNPVQENLKVEFLNDLNDCKLILFDFLGKQVLEQDIHANTMKFDLSNLRQGVYFVSIKNEEEVVILKEKLIKK